MDELTIQEINDWYTNAISTCTIVLLNKSDEDLQVLLFEDIDTDATSVLHIDTLHRLLANGYLNNDLLLLSIELGEKLKHLLNSSLQRSADFVRNSKQWKEVFELGDKIYKLKREFDKLRVKK